MLIGSEKMNFLILIFYRRQYKARQLIKLLHTEEIVCLATNILHNTASLTNAPVCACLYQNPAVLFPPSLDNAGHGEHAERVYPERVLQEGMG